MTLLMAVIMPSVLSAQDVVVTAEDWKDKRWEISAGVGFVTMSEIEYDKDLMRRYPFEEMRSGVPKSTSYYIGASYFVSRRLAVGGMLAYSTSEYWESGSDGWEKDFANYYYSDKRKYFIVMPTAKYYWSRRQHWSWYANVGVGLHLLNKDKTVVGTPAMNQSGKRNFLHASWQVSPIAVEYAPESRFVIFAEMGVGTIGDFTIGGRVRF